ncbi:MAG: lytic transglycosylase domain-containing protein [Clostridiales bacterium]|jgi:soluble lytic murein transglycosylase|nr:lytic transglycosylase domain-containing protein [Clostridiales bacterium]
MFYTIRLRGIKKFLIFLFCGFLAVFFVVCVRFRYPLKYMDIIRKNAEAYGLEPSFVCAVIHAESKFRETARSHKDASGLMQVTRGTADWIAPLINLPDYSYERIFEPSVNIQIGCGYLAWLLNHYNQDRNLAAAAYNAGSGNVDKWLKNKAYSSDGQRLETIPFPETRVYLKRIQWNQKIYDMILMFIQV